MAAEWDLAPEVLLSAKDYELIIRLGAGEKGTEPARWQGWRADRLLRPLLALATEVQG